MGGFFGVVSKQDCVSSLFYGTDYHSHLGTRRGGLAVHHGTGCTRFIHDITNAQFRSKFEQDVLKLTGRMGIGVISDTEDQPLIIGSHLGNYAMCTTSARAARGPCIQQVLDFLLARSTVRDIRVRVDPARLRPSDVMILEGDPCRARRAVGWQVEIPFEQTLAELLDYWRERVRRAAW